MRLGRIILIAVLVEAAALAQTGSVSGTVVDSVTGAPIAGATVRMGHGATTDDKGRYKVTDLEPGQYRVQVNPPPGGTYMGLQSQGRMLTITPGLDLTGIDMRLVPYARISGKVVDDDGHPIPGVPVTALLHRGSQYLAMGLNVTTDGRGEYLFAQVMPDADYLMATTPGSSVVGVRPVKAMADSPEDPERRRQFPVPTYYPDATEPESGLTMRLHPGESRERVDLHQRRSPSYCIVGVLQAADGPDSFGFSLRRRTSQVRVMGKTGVDGRLRLCDVYAGEYSLVGADETGRELYGATPVTVVDHDVRDVRVVMQSPTGVEGEVVLEGPPPVSPLEGMLTVRLSQSDDKTSLYGQAKIPGRFVVSLFPAREYSVGVIGTPAGWYLKDVSYSGVSVTGRALRPDTISGTGGIRVVLAQDGGYVSVLVNDADGKPRAGASVVIFPSTATPDGDLAPVATGSTDQNGRYQSPMLAPGKYYAAASEDELPVWGDAKAQLRAMRDKATEVTVGDGGTVNLTLVLREH